MKKKNIYIYIFATVSFFLCFILYLKAISKYSPLGAYTRRVDLMEGFLRYEFGGLTLGGAYFRNFTACLGLNQPDACILASRSIPLQYSSISLTLML